MTGAQPQLPDLHDIKFARATVLGAFWVARKDSPCEFIDAPFRLTEKVIVAEELRL